MIYKINTIRMIFKLKKKLRINYQKRIKIIIKIKIIYLNIKIYFCKIFPLKIPLKINQLKIIKIIQ